MKDINELKTRKAVLDSQIKTAEAELAEIDKGLVAEGITADTDIDQFLGEQQEAVGKLSREYDELYDATAQELSKAEAAINA